MGQNLRMQDSTRNSVPAQESTAQPQDKGQQNRAQPQNTGQQNTAQPQETVPGQARRPRIGIPVRLSSSADPDPRVAKANSLFGCIVSLIRDVGGDPVLLTPETVEGAPNG